MPWSANACRSIVHSDWRLYSKALTAAELTEVMRGEPWLAWDPQPGNGTQTDVLRASTLSWKVGDGATTHDVYVSTDSDALQNADVDDTTGVYHGRHTETSYALGDVQPITTYYWRIDEVQADGSIHKGNAWSFMTANFLIVDDFEDYDIGSNEIWWAWKDGIGYASHPHLAAASDTSSHPLAPDPKVRICVVIAGKPAGRSWGLSEADLAPIMKRLAQAEKNLGNVEFIIGQASTAEQTYQLLDKAGPDAPVLTFSP